MEFRVLGPLEVVRDGTPVALGARRQRALLALLLISAPQVVSTDRIIDELWADDGASERQNALWVHVSNLRSTLEPDRVPRAAGTVIVTRAPGYLLALEPDQLDAHRFERLLQEGRSLIDHDPGTAAVVIGEALTLWRGRAYEDFLYDSFAQAEIARLEELRLEAVELRLDADLRRGLGRELVAELEGLARDHPLRERFTGLLMLALHRAGRRADALRAYGRLRHRLADELGLEPTAALQTLERQILAGDPTLERPGATAGTRTRLAVRGYELRKPIGADDLGTTFRAYQPGLGREVAVTITRPEVANDPAFIRRFETEAELVARLEHPHIVPLYDFWREPDAAYLVTRLPRAKSLADAAGRAPLPPPRAAQVVTDVGSALTVAHAHGVVHGDLGPEHVVVDDSGRAYLRSFPIAADSDVRTTRAPATDVAGLAHVLEFALTGGDPTRPLPARLRAVIDDGTSGHYGDVASFVAAVQQVAGAPEVEPGPSIAKNPYKGLRAFEEGDAAEFFGRERHVERILARLGDAGTRGRFVAVVGASGSGKSSVVRAGVLAALRRDALPGSSGWFVATMVPGPQPFEELETGLRRVAVHPPTDLLGQLSGGAAGLRRAASRILPDPNAQLLLVVDQFEELFTQADDATASAFLDALAGTVDDPHSRVKVIVTLRADHYDRPLQHRGIGELLRRGTEVLTPMAPDELERAITGPAERAGVRVDPGVVAEIVAASTASTGALPLVQYALTELFARRTGDTMELSTYRDMGGVSGALIRRADALYGELDDEDRAVLRQVLLRLVMIGPAGEVARRRVLLSELTGLGGPCADAVLRAFGRHRLVTFDRDPVSRGPTVEIAHEALLASWERLRDWIDDARDDVHNQRRLTAGAQEWEASGRDDGYLLDGAALERLAVWASTSDLALHPSERAFLDASLERRARQRAAEEARTAREQRLRRQTRQRTVLAAAIAVVLALIAGLAAFAVGQRNDAERLADEVTAVAEARRLSAPASSVAGDDPQLALHLALAALDASAGAGMPALEEAESALHWALQGARVAYPPGDAAPVGVRIGPDGRTGVYDLPLADLMTRARAALTRDLTAEECARYGLDPCTARPVRTPADAPSTDAPAGAALAGTRVVLSSVARPSAGLEAELADFTERTGIEVVFRLSGASEDEPVDVALGLLAHEVRARAETGEFLELSGVVSPDAARAAYGDHLVALASHDGGLYALPVSLDLKGLVWYPVDAFAAAGYAVPQTWDELVALSERIVVDGSAPWCLGIESGDATGWPATDWIEALVLRLGGIEAYDRWMSHALAFDTPLVREATTMFGTIAFGEGFVAGGSETIATRNFNDVAAMLRDPPGCWLYSMASFALDRGALPPAITAGTTVDFFVLPPIEPGAPTPMFGGGSFAVAFRDRPEVREVLRALTGSEWGTAWAAEGGSDFIPAHTGFDPQRCAARGDDARANEVRVRLCRLTRDALAAGTWRYDASDAMPAAVGAGAFWRAMVSYAEAGPAVLATALARIDAAWSSAASTTS